MTRTQETSRSKQEPKPKMTVIPIRYQAILFRKHVGRSSHLKHFSHFSEKLSKQRYRDWIAAQQQHHSRLSVLLYDFICLRQVSAPESINCVGFSSSTLTQIVKLILFYFLHQWSLKKVDDSYKLSGCNNNLHFLNAQSHSEAQMVLVCLPHISNFLNNICCS